MNLILTKMGLLLLIKGLLADKTVENEYVNAGAQFGSAVSYIYMGECIGFKSMLNTWGGWEQEYAKRGYRTVSLDDFIELGGYGKSIDPLLGVKRGEKEEPVYHAQIYENEFLGKIEPSIDIAKMMSDGQPQVGEYGLPSTKSDPK
jgi:hypothetical protein